MTRARSEDGDLVTPSLLLRAYACGIFPMADSADDPTLYWVEPRLRGIVPLDGFHVPGRLARSARRLTVHLPTGWPWQEPWEQLAAAAKSPPLAA